MKPKLYPRIPATISRFGAHTKRVIDIFVARQIQQWTDEFKMAATPPDPFAIERECRSPGGHEIIISGADIVCPHCERVLAW